MPFYVFGKEYDNLLPEIMQEKHKKKDLFKLTILNEDQDEEEDLEIDDGQYSDDEFI